MVIIFIYTGQIGPSFITYSNELMYIQLHYRQVLHRKRSIILSLFYYLFTVLNALTNKYLMS
jgi:hypothetical protein